MKLESEGIRAVKQLGLATSTTTAEAATTIVAANKNANLNNLRMNNHDDESFKECDTNRKF